jgi:hypothetical protein
MSALRFSDDQILDDGIFFPNKRKATADGLARKSWNYITSRYINGEEECSAAVVQSVTLLAIYEYIGM